MIKFVRSNNPKIKLKMKKYLLNGSLFIALIVFASCGGANKPSTEASADSIATVADEDTLPNETTYNIPSAIETFILLKNSGATFDKSLLNPSTNISKYVTNFSKAINLGVYSADLSLCLLYEQKQLMNTYLKNTSDLTASLNIEGEFMQSVAKRVTNNSANIDSLKKIVSEVNVSTNLFLGENKMNNTTAIMAVGGWIEAMYVISKIADKTQNKPIISLIADQKFVIKNLVSQLENYKSDKEIAALLADIQDISVIYNSLKQVTAQAVPKPAEEGIVSIGNNTSYELSTEQLKLILEKITALRNKITS